MKAFKKIMAAGLSAMMILGLAACNKDYTWSVRFQDETYSSGYYIVNLMNAYLSASNKMEDPTADVLKQKFDDKDASQWITDTARQEILKDMATRAKFAEMGLTMNDDDFATVEAYTEYQWSYVSAIYENNGVSKDSYKKMIESNVIANNVFLAYFGENGTEPVSTDEVKKYLEDNYYVATQIAYSKPAEDAEDKESKLKEIQDKAQDIINRVEKGEKFNDLYNEYKKSVYGDSVTINENDYENYIQIKKDGTDTTVSEQVLKALESAEYGKPFIVEDDKYVYVLEKEDALGNADYVKSKYETVLFTLKSDAFADLQDQWAEGITDQVTFNKDTINYYTPKKIKIS